MRKWVQEQIGKVNNISLDWYAIKNKPSAYPPLDHHHEMTDIYGLSASLGKASILRTDGKENEFLNGKGN